MKGRSVVGDRFTYAGSCLVALSFDGAVDGGAADAEELSDLGGAVVTAVDQGYQVRFLTTVELRLLPAEAALRLRDPHALAVTEPDQVGLNSATIASTLNSNRPTASVGSYTDPPILRLTCRVVSSSAMARASGSDRASRSSFVTTSVSPAR